MHYHFYITYYIDYDPVKLETRHVPSVDDLCTSTGTWITSFSSAEVDDSGSKQVSEIRYALIFNNIQPSTINHPDILALQ